MRRKTKCQPLDSDSLTSKNLELQSCHACIITPTTHFESWLDRNLLLFLLQQSDQCDLPRCHSTTNICPDGEEHSQRHHDYHRHHQRFCESLAFLGLIESVPWTKRRRRRRKRGRMAAFSLLKSSFESESSIDGMESNEIRRRTRKRPRTYYLLHCSFSAPFTQRRIRSHQSVCTRSHTTRPCCMCVVVVLRDGHQLERKSQKLFSRTLLMAEWAPRESVSSSMDRSPCEWNTQDHFPGYQCLFPIQIGGDC